MTKWTQVSVLALLALPIPSPGQTATAQASELERSRLNYAAYYNYSDPKDVTIKVHVWGSVRYPGLYEIPQETRVLELISLAGGPSAAERERRQTRTVSIRLERGDGASRTAVFDQTMRNSIAVGEENPGLLDGDVLAVESVVRQGVSWRDVFPVISSAFTLVLLIDRISQ